MLNILNRIYNTPLLITPTYGRLLSNYLAQRSGNAQPFAEMDHKGRAPVSDMQAGSVALIPVMGSLANRAGQMEGMSSVMRSYSEIQQDITAAASMDSVEKILLDFDSPGGEACGCFELADWIREFDAGKPVVGHINGMACSAAYAIASSCDHLVATKSSDAGSIGVVMMHMDVSRALEKDGYDVTFIHSGAHKVDGNPYEPLTDDVAASFQAKCDESYGRFIATVGNGRRMPSDQIKSTEASVFSATEARELGLIDEIGSLAVALSYSDGEETFSPPAAQQLTQGDVMSDEPTGGLYSEEDMTAAKALAKADGLKEGQLAATEAAEAAASAERDRISGLIQAGVAAGKREAALQLAFTPIAGSYVSAEDAVQLLALAEADAKPETVIEAPSDAAIAAGVAAHLGSLTQEITADAVDPAPEQSRIKTGISKARGAL